MLRGKKILLGVSGSIAAYKAAFLIRLLIKEQAEVQVVTTPSACSFISPLTLSTLSKKVVLTEFVKDQTGQWNNHVDLALWADIVLIAPATANTIAKCANGFCDNLLTAIYLSAQCPVVFAPAMDLDMYLHKSVRNNLQKLKKYGNYIIDAEHGELASGLIGQGRMAEPEYIIDFLSKTFSTEGLPLSGKRVLITAGPTFEAIDPVRFIGNRSSGKMGYALAEECKNKGADVTLISGPSHLKAPAYIDFIAVEDAETMYSETLRALPSADIIILSAAVADYKPAFVHKEKMKKGANSESLSIPLERTKDIAAEVGKLKRSNQLTVGFALETENEQANAIGKIQSKNLDFIVLNSLKDYGAGFGHDTNKVSIIDKNNNVQNFGLKSKAEVAKDIVQQILKTT
jgi:phosphopantothenoylcysteine decarboxylase/phosphopantothenate--cysteine ligase